MSDWSEGYVTEIDYTYGFYKEMTPVAMRFALSAAGFEAPPIERFNYCELGFGQGAGLCLAAAANPQGEFWGTDFNPAHAAGAEQLARGCALGNVHVFDDSFEQFGQRELPQFDYIALHGIWSWVSAKSRQLIVDFIARHLKVGGALYISYNTQPGWSHALPLRGFLSQFVEQQTAPAESIQSRFDSALKMLVALNEVPGSYFKQTPQLAERIKQLQTQNKNYLIHEYLNQNWTPMFFSQVVEELEAAKLTFAAHANPLNCIDTLNHTPELQAILDKIPNPIFKEVVRDYGINQPFRRDIFVRGARRMSREEHAATLLDMSYALVTERSKCGMKIRTTVGEAQLQANVYEPILDVLVKGPRVGRSLLDLPAVAEAGAGRLLQALVVLVGTGFAQPCMPQAQIKAAKAPVARFNQHILSRSARTPNGELLFLASPLLGSGIAQSRISQLFIRAVAQQPNADVAALAHNVWAVLKGFGQALLQDGKTIQGDEGNLAELRARMKDWLDDHLPIARNLQLV